MIRKNLAVRIGLAIMGLMLVVSIVQYIALGQLLRNAFYQQSGLELIVQGQQYANMSSMGGTMMMQMLCTTSDTSLVMVGTDGNIITASPSLHLGKPDASDSSTIRTALSGQSELHGGYSSLFGNSGIMAAVPIGSTGKITGAVVLFRPEGIVETAFHHVEWLLLLVGVGGILVALGLTVILSNRIAGPLRQLAAVAREMSRGDYSSKVEITGDDEVGKLGEAINELAANLQHLETSRKQFLADVSHELRTPMSYIRGYSQVLAEGLVQSPKEKEDYLRIIHDESIRLEGLINDLFTLAQSDAGMLKIVKQPIQLEDVVYSVVDRMRKKAEDKEIEIQVSVSPLPRIDADSARLEQVLVNLIDNAIRYTPPRGRIEVSLIRLADWAEVKVSDTGVGIPAKDLPHIWDRLYRVEKSRSRVGGGTGLGLSIVKQIVEAHGGTVQAESAENVGTTITVRIPLHGSDAPQG
ncbi:sensor histidine kinase [Alicyclobacillus acidiphilus]|uniref:sensor histidine kinase n=1 Tax=Alicyclobacillus acidiphilus TaxID=182455 RepID=UPI000835203F|nr:HAMP domain-containing sensor histidine kinase [Alicyclobacillus acidiphilus]